MANIVAIVGRPNVGKSTFFNRLVGKRDAITDNESGVTRDRQYGYAEWIGKHFTVIDTGGYVSGSKDLYEGAIREQVGMALNEASCVLFMVDTKDGLTGLDKEFAKIIRQIKKPVFIVANKADTTEMTYMVGDFYGLGFKNIFSISSSNGYGTGELLDAVVETFEYKDTEDPEDGIPRISILGRPNVGKSSFLNALIGVDRSIVTDKPGTTRNSINTHYNLFGKNFILTDTAGIRKKTKVKENLEFYSVLRSLQSLQNSDVCIIIIDAERGLEAQDINIIALADKYGKGILIMVNKWDLIKKETDTSVKISNEMKQKLGPLSYIPIVFSSVLNKQRIFKTIELAVKVYGSRIQKISTSKLNNTILPQIERQPPPALKGKYIRIKYITQLPTQSVSFALFCNFPQYIKLAYQRFIENKLRSNFDLEGVPINVFFRKK